MSNTPEKWYRINALGQEPVKVHLVGQIGYYGISARAFINELRQHQGKPIEMSICSVGGDVWEAFAIYNYMLGQNVTVQIDGLAASAASFLAMGGKRVKMSENSHIMIHNPWTMSVGESDELRASADMLDRSKETVVGIYAKRSGMDKAKVSSLMDSEKWFNAQEALEAKLIDEITPAANIYNVAHLNLGALSSIPGAVHSYLNEHAAELAKVQAGISKPLSPQIHDDGVYKGPGVQNNQGAASASTLSEQHKAHLDRMKRFRGSN